MNLAFAAFILFRKSMSLSRAKKGSTLARLKMQFLLFNANSSYLITFGAFKAGAHKPIRHTREAQIRQDPKSLALSNGFSKNFI